MIYLERDEPIPASLAEEKLKPNGDYACEDVVDALSRIFRGKCYLCEDNPQSINVEHFKPHQGDVDLKFDWDNLFYSCSHCNNTKLAGYDDILNCTKDVEVERKIHYSVPLAFVEEIVVTPLADDQVSRNTAELIGKVFNGETAGKKISTNYLRGRVVSQLAGLFERINKLVSQNTSPDQKDRLKIELADELSTYSLFSSIKRGAIRDRPGVLRILEELIPHLELRKRPE